MTTGRPGWAARQGTTAKDLDAMALAFPANRDALTLVQLDRLPRIEVSSSAVRVVRERCRNAAHRT
jgi:hypothetical protein